MHSLAEAYAYLPAGHCVYPVAAEAVADPDMEAKFPATTSLHSLSPVLLEYLPEEHAVHTVAPAVEYLPATQFVVPTAALLVPMPSAPIV